MKKYLIAVCVALSVPAMACTKTGYYLFVNKTQTSLWFESKDACKRGARELNLMVNGYKCVSSK